jgi:hypothetical protein
MEEQKQEKLPLDARLLSEAVIELNISRRNVGLYPPEHAIIKDSIARAHSLLESLFELRSEITLGIAKDALVIDEHTLDRKNPVFKEFALSLHNKGIAAITFSSGLTKEELVGLHELITMKDAPTGKGIVELAEKKGIRHITLNPIDFSTFKFIEGARRAEGAGGDTLEDYVYGLLEGKLTTDDSAAALLSAPPEEVASLLNNAMSADTKDETYERVITTYLRKKGETQLSRESFEKFLSLIDNLNPTLKRQFLSRTFTHHRVEIKDVEKILTEMTSESFQKMVEIFTRHSSMVPDTLKNLIDKLSSIKEDTVFDFDVLLDNEAVVHDIEIDEDIIGLFKEDHFKTFVSNGYQRDLTAMLKASPVKRIQMEELGQECKSEVIDRVTSEVILEALEAGIATNEEYLTLLTRLTELATEFVETGRFEEILNIYNTLYPYSLSGSFTHEISSVISYFFHSEAFISKFINAIKLWGKRDREGVTRLARVLKAQLIPPLVDALLEEGNASHRRYLLSLLGELGSDVVPEAVRRLDDRRWYVVRNMLYLLRECGNGKHANHVRRFVKHKNTRICIEAVKTLLHFKTADSVPYLKFYLQSNNARLREQAIRLAGAYRVKAAVPYLLDILEKRDMLGADSYYKISVVKALGDIGDKSAIPHLLKIYNSKALLFKGSLEELKVEIFRNLDNYPLEALKPLLEAGQRSKNEEIKTISRDYLQRILRKKKGYY